MIIRGLSMPLATYRRRRREAAMLANRHVFGPIPILLLGCDEGRLRRERQDPWFDYYCGCMEPDAALLILPDGTATLFLDPGDPSRVVWDGKRLGPGTKAAKSHGVERTAHIHRLEEAVRAAAVDGRIGMCTRTREPGFQADATALWRKRLAPDILVAHIEPALVHQRMIKDADEIAWHRRAIAITRDGLGATLRELPTLKTESQVAARLVMHYRQHDYGPLAFPPIVGSAVNGATLHYPFNDRPLEAKRPLLIDSGATAGGYCADVTRTVPVHGRFDDKRFREVYELVLRCNAIGRARARPGISRKELNDLAWKPIIDAGFERHHGLWHHIGLDVHDPADYDVPLAAGMIISNEPGVYLPKEGFGIRIEDDLLITEDGCEDMTRSIPKAVPELEAWMRG